MWTAYIYKGGKWIIYEDIVKVFQSSNFKSIFSSYAEEEINEEEIEEIKQEVIALIKAQIPKKIKDYISISRFICPSCRTHIQINPDMNYCYYCGQALDFYKEELDQ